MVTGASDIYALDVDASDGGLEAFERMAAEHGSLPGDTPMATTGNGGLHILFSLPASVEAGLKERTNKAHISYKGEAVGIDTRGEGWLLYIEPSRFRGCHGTRRSYHWEYAVAEDRSNLKAMLAWLIDVLNSTGPPLR
jgi:hypothetical protein